MFVTLDPPPAHAVPPRFDPLQEGVVAVRRGSQGRLTCVARGDAPLTLSWHPTPNEHSVTRWVERQVEENAG